MTAAFSPGDLVHARGREWVALPSPDEGWLCLRPLSGAEADIQLIHPTLEREKPRPARFALPEPLPLATQSAAQLLSEALRLSLRRGAGPFRSAARLSFEPRAYQLVPLLMALRLQTVRLLIADDVGIGKTIEAGLILRELIDRGEAEAFSILCPPHLVEQWTGELREKFDIDTVAVTAASAARLERGLPQHMTLFDANPHTVVSLDYIKAEKRRDSFARACPGLVIVDEAHASVGTHQGRHQRFELLKRLSEDATRHLILLTATPHSGDEEAFERLLGLIDPEFSGRAFEDERSRIRLARHFVQRRRIDVTSREWGEERSFPRHETSESPYNLDNAHSSFHDAVLDYCLGVVENAGTGQRERRLAFWGTLALMRCVGSSPAAAASALRNRLRSDPDRLGDHVFDDDGEDEDAIDVEPASGLDTGPLASLVAKAEYLTRAPDPKIAAAVKVLSPLIKAGANPVVFCRYIATADHVSEALRKAFPKLRIEAVTGALTGDERRARVEAMADDPQRLLVATDCLSEGINLQHLFDTVVHYDLSWNPTRHQQREGRVDRFGQSAPLVRSLLLFSPDSSIDGAVLEVILRKAEAIRKATGVTVPLPEERGAVTGALMNAVLLRKGRIRQLTLDFGFDQEAKNFETRWRDAEEGEKASRARFAQNAMKPEEVAPEWKKWRELLGGPAEICRFTSRAMSRLDAPLETVRENSIRAHLGALPKPIAERLAARGLEGTIKLSFEEPPSSGHTVVTRSHPLPATLAESLLEGALDPVSGPTNAIGRAGAWSSSAVSALTTVALLRLRFKLTVHGRTDRMLLVEEASAIAFDSAGLIATGDAARAMLDAEAAGNLAEVARVRVVTAALARIETFMETKVADHARERAAALAEDHDRLRKAGADASRFLSRVSVEPVLPADVIGLFVLAPAVI
ncbi:MAG: DEAD/DEAH box helicase [Mesorhizobium sp.]|uniref:DEAD/DEAH box helicase n=1 Tax=Mesorhizobium sp. TaxID=1871066 RepID=UPI001217B17C|nr:DEAD/DEAH box helicase [Mesorhizobium sp.]TIP26213.1 MAG: DEAD/DEAH box helicase [Mesorhizobium sp.]